MESASRAVGADDLVRPVSVVGQNLWGADELIRRTVTEVGSLIGFRRITPAMLAGEIAAVPLARVGRAARPGANNAVVARALMRLDDGDFGRFSKIAHTPGFAGAIGHTLSELSDAGIEASDLEEEDPDLGRIAAAVRTEWRAAGLASQADVFRAATTEIVATRNVHPALGTPLVLLDVAPRSRVEHEFIAAVVARAPEVAATVSAGDKLARQALLSAGGVEEPPQAIVSSSRGSSRERSVLAIQESLFADPDDAESDDADNGLVVFSAPGEGRECIEIARMLLQLSRAGTPFDRCAIILRTPDRYLPYLDEALGRAEVPAWYTFDEPRPSPAGRAFLALLRCRLADYSVASFAEYLSIGEVPPYPDTEGPVQDAATEDADDGDAANSGHRRRWGMWEKILVDAKIVSGLDRWEARLEAFLESMERDRDALLESGASDEWVERRASTIESLNALKSFALPMLEALATLPEEATWSEWLPKLDSIAARALRHPGAVQSALASMDLLGPIGPVSLEEVIRELTVHLTTSSKPKQKYRYGRVFVGSCEDVRGLEFDVVFVPGLADHAFPERPAEDPILPDSTRSRLSPDLARMEDRVARERLAFRLAVGAAREQIVVSWPRIDAALKRPRVPSFFALEVFRADRGHLPSLEEIEVLAAKKAGARISWPAPHRPGESIDDSEYDLAVMDQVQIRGVRAVRGIGHLLNSNSHLARALRFRASRWEVPKWTAADGLVASPGADVPGLDIHFPANRAFSPTALQNFATCPYKFYLYALLRLRPLEKPEGIERLDALQRGSLFHQIQFELLTRLQRESVDGRPLLPFTSELEEEVLNVLDEVVEQVASEYREQLVPMIDPVWNSELEDIRHDLYGWVQREGESASDFVPWRFELAFGLPAGVDRDPRSVSETVRLDVGGGLELRGSIDLLERSQAGELRVTDHKTGRAKLVEAAKKKGSAVIDGGETLQPALYALVAEQLFPDHTVSAGRLHYCTHVGEFQDRAVPLDDTTRDAADLLVRTLHSAFDARQIPALPRANACRWCDYRPVCGPDEERRVEGKPIPMELSQLRDHP